MVHRYLILVLFFSFLAPCFPHPASKPAFKTSSTSGFIENKGQIIDQNNKSNPAVLYLLTTPGFNVQLRRGGFSYDLYRTSNPEKSGQVIDQRFLKSEFSASRVSRLASRDSNSVISYHRIDIDLLDANPNPAIETSAPSPDYFNYFTASTPPEGIKNVRQYSKITYKNIYPGIDLEFFTNEKHGYKYNFVIHPGANINDIRLRISGPDNISLHQDILEFGTRFGEVEELIPESYCLVNNSKVDILTRFIKIGQGVYSFSSDNPVPENSMLVIDPTTVRLWGTYYGGYDWDSEAQCSVDNTGNVFLAGATLSSNNIATAGAFQITLTGNIDGFLAKFNAAGQRQWGTYFGGELNDELESCIVSNSGSIYVSGHTGSTYGIATTGAHQTVFGGGLLDCYIEKFDQAGARLWGTYYGGADWDSPGYLTADNHGNIFLAGSTKSDTGIATPGTYQPARNGSKDAFLAKFNSNGVRQWGTYFGGEFDDIAYNCTTDSTGNEYIVGYTVSQTNIASPGAHQTTIGGWNDCFIAKFTTDGQRLWSSYYGGTFGETGLGCCTDNSRNVYLAGRTESSLGIASTASHQPQLGGYDDAFLVKFDSLGVRQWGTYYGGTGNEFAYSCATGRNNDIFMAGFTMSDNNISTPDAYQPALGGDVDGFIVKFNTEGVRQWGTYYGGPDGDEFLKCSYSADDTLYLSGYTYSATAIASPDGHQNIYWGTRDDMLVKFVECLPIAAAGPITGPATVHRNSSGIPYSIPPIANALNYIWTLPPGATIAGGAGTNSITVNFSGTATSGNIWVKGMNKCGPGDSASLYITLLPEFFSVGFIAPDTTCINQNINITDTTTSGTTYYWNFCSGNANTDPTGINIGNPGGLLSIPTYITLVKQHDSCFSFISCQGVGVIRYYHGSSFKNNPVSWTNLGQFGIIDFDEEGIQVKKDNGNWYGFVNSDTTVIRLDFGASLANTPTAVNLNISHVFSMTHGLAIIKEGNTWLGFITSAVENNIFRLNFGPSLSNTTPGFEALGNPGNCFFSPSTICIVEENSSWYIIVSAGTNTLARLSFGSSLLNTPTGQNLGNPGGMNTQIALTILRDCGSTSGYYCNYLVNGQLGKLTFPSGVDGTVTGQLLGNIGNLNQPHSFSEIFRQNDTLYAYITNHGSGTLTRLTFLPCYNASVGSSTLYTPPPFSYNQLGTYNIRLIVNEGSPTQGAVCKPIVIVNPPTINLGSDDSICPVATKILNAGAGFSSYLWSTGATTQTITITTPGTYWVNATKWGCTATDTIHITPAAGPVITISGNSVVYQGNTEVYTTQPGMTGYTWTFSAGGTWVSGGTPTDNTITIQWNSIGVQWVRVNYSGPNGCTAFLPTQLNVNVIPTIWFVVPDTICLTQPINIVNNTTGGTTYYWNFCSGNANTNPEATDIGNPQGTLHQPVHIILVKQGTDCFSFSANQVPPCVSRHYHGTSFSNDPVSSVNFGSFGLLVVNRVEGIQVKNDNGTWYGFVNNNTNIVRLDFGTSLWNTPTATTIPCAGMNLGNGLFITKEGTTWLGLLVNSYGTNLFRLNFGASLSNPNPAVENLGNIGSLNHPEQIQVLAENGIWYLFVMNAYSNSLTRITFGSSLLNTPTGVNLGNPGGLDDPVGISIFQDCNSTTGYFTNWINNGEIGRLTFTGGLTGSVTGTVLPYLGIYNHPACFSELVRENDTLFLYVPVSLSSELLRLSFPPCNNASPSSSTLFTPPPVSYNQPGTYNIQLLVDEGLSSAANLCKPVVVLDPPVVNLGNDDSICPGGIKILNAGPGFSGYHWSTGATTESITVNTTGTYWVDAMKWGCMASDTVHLNLAPAPVVNLGNDTMICAETQITFDAGACSGCTYQWMNLITGLPVGSNQTFTTNQAGIYKSIVTNPFGCTGSDTVQLATNSTPSVTNNPLSKTICSGNLTNIILTSTPPEASFSWTATGSSPFVTGYSPGNGTNIYQVLINTNSSAETVTYSITPYIESCTGSPVDFVVTVNPNFPVSISISASANPVCAGTFVTFTANPTNQGSSPVFQWKVNGLNVGANNPVYSYIPVSGDTVKCALTSNVLCPVGNPATSNQIIMTVNPNLPVSITITASNNPVCSGISVTYTATPVNGGNSPGFQWKVNGNNAGTNSNIYTYNPASGDQVSCILTSNIACPIGNPATSNSITMNVASLPIVTFTRCNDSITTTGAKPFKLKGGIPLNGTYSGPGVTNGIFSPGIAGTGTKTIIYTYINASLCSASATITIIVMSTGAFVCGNNLTDIRDNKTYPTVQIGAQCWLAEDLNYGVEIPADAAQRDNCIPEKYHNPASSIQHPASVYQWDEIMNYDETVSNEGLCPPGWHVPTEADWNTLFGHYISNAFAGSPLKYSGFSGFNALLSGTRYLNKTWDYSGFATFFWSSTSYGITKAWGHGMNDADPSVSLYPAYRSNAFSVRCIKD